MRTWKDTRFAAVLVTRWKTARHAGPPLFTPGADDLHEFRGPVVLVAARWKLRDPRISWTVRGPRPRSKPRSAGSCSNRKLTCIGATYLKRRLIFPSRVKSLPLDEAFMAAFMGDHANKRATCGASLFSNSVPV